MPQKRDNLEKWEVTLIVKDRKLLFCLVKLPPYFIVVKFLFLLFCLFLCKLFLALNSQISWSRSLCIPIIILSFQHKISSEWLNTISLKSTLIKIYEHHINGFKLQWTLGLCLITKLFNLLTYLIKLLVKHMLINAFASLDESQVKLNFLRQRVKESWILFECISQFLDVLLSIVFTYDPC